MQKLVAFAFLLICLSNCQLTPAQQDLQQFVNGVYQENNLTPPTSIVACIDPTTAQNIVTFVGQILPKLASASIADLPSIVKQIQAFGKTIPQSVQTCLKSDPDVAPLEAKYGISANTNWPAMITKITSYLTLHWSSVHKSLQSINSSWQAGNYTQAGNQLANLGHNILGAIDQQSLLLLEEEELTLTAAQTILQTFLNGITYENKLSNTTTVIPCFVPPSDQNTVTFIGAMFKAASSGSINQVVTIINEIADYVQQLPDSVKTCVATNQQVQPLLIAYGITNNTSWVSIANQLIQYVTFHFSQFQKSMQSINSLWLAQNYYNSGYQFGSLLHQMLGQNIFKLTQQSPAQVILQQAFNGLFQDNNLPNPTNVVQCFTPPNDANLVQFINDNLPKAAKGSINDLLSLIKAAQAFGETIPQSVTDCLKNNQELKQLGLAYGIDENTSPIKIESKVISYVTFHYSALHKSLQSINSFWLASNYFQAGYQAGVLGHNVLGADDEQQQ